jgi:hypothetical protein
LLAFSRALSEERADDAYALMSPEYQERVGLAEWKQKLAHPQEVTELANALDRSLGSARQWAEVVYGEGLTARLVESPQGFRITTDLLDFYDQSTPRAALRSFLHAMRSKRYSEVLRFIPEADRDGDLPSRLSTAAASEREDLERVLSSLEQHVDAPIEVSGQHATMPYAEQRRVQFVREGDFWKLEDLE